LKWLVTLTTVLRYRAACDIASLPGSKFTKLRLPTWVQGTVESKLLHAEKFAVVSCGIWLTGARNFETFATENYGH